MKNEIIKILQSNVVHTSTQYGDFITHLEFGNVAEKIDEIASFKNSIELKKHTTASSEIKYSVYINDFCIGSFIENKNHEDDAEQKAIKLYNNILHGMCQTGNETSEIINSDVI